MAGCSQCGKGRGWVPPPTTSDGRLRVNGVYQLATYPDCSDPYIGTERKEWVYVVGYRTEHERLFKRSDKGAMVTYFNSFKGEVEMFHDLSAEFCQQAMMELLGS